MAKTYQEMVAERQKTTPAETPGGASSGKKTYEELLKKRKGEVIPVPVSEKPVPPAPVQRSTLPAKPIGQSGPRIPQDPMKQEIKPVTPKTPFQEKALQAAGGLVQGAETALNVIAPKVQAVQDFLSKLKSVGTKDKKDPIGQLNSSVMFGPIMGKVLTDPKSVIRTGATVGSNVIQAAKEIGKKMVSGVKADTSRGATVAGASAGLDAVLNFMPGGFMFAQGLQAAPELAKEATGSEKAADVTRKASEATFGAVSQVGSEGLVGLIKATGAKLSPVEEQSIRDTGAMAASLAAFALLHKAAGSATGRYGKALEAKSVSGTVDAFANTLGLKTGKGLAGETVLPKESKINQAYERAVTRYGNEGGQNAAAKIDAARVTRDLLLDYKKNGAAGFEAKWQPVFEQGSSLATKVLEDVAHAADAVKIKEVVTKPYTGKTKDIIEAIETPAGQFAFEREFGQLSEKNTPKIPQGSKYKIVKEDVPFDDRPGYFDAADGSVRLNDHAIGQDVARMMKGEKIYYGEGRTRKVFEVMKGETPEALTKRYQQEILNHELSHVETVTPEDLARIEIAKSSGSQKDLDAIRRDLEGKANRYMEENRPPVVREERFQVADESSAQADRAIKAFEREGQYQAKKEGQRFADPSKEAAYTAWKKLRPEIREADWAGLRERVRSKELLKKLDDTVAGGKGTNDGMLDDFRNRSLKEKSARAEHQKAKDAQSKLFPELPKNETRVIEKELSRYRDRALKAEGKVDTGKRKTDLKLLKQRITDRLKSEKLATSAKEAAGAVIRKLRSKGDEKVFSQAEVVRFARTNGVPFEVRGKMLAKLKNVKTVEGAQKVIAQMRELWTEVERVNVQKKIMKLKKQALTKVKNGVRAGKVDADTQKVLNLLYGDKKNPGILKMSRVDAIETQLRLIAENTPESLGMAELYELGGLKEQSLTKLRDTQAAIEEFLKTGKTKRQQFFDERKAEVQTTIDSAVKELTGKEGGINETQAKAERVGALKQFSRGVMDETAVFADMGREIGGKFEQFTRDVQTRVHESGIAAGKHAQKVETKLSEVYGKDYLTELSKFVSEQKDLGVMTDAAGNRKNVRMNRGAALDLYMKMKDPAAKELLMDPRRQAYTEEMMNRIVDEVLTVKDKQMGDWLMKDTYSDVFKNILAPAHERFTGVPLGYKDNYSGQWKFKHESWRENEDSFAANLMRDGALHQMSNKPGFVKERTANAGSLELSQNPILDFIMYAKKSEQYARLGEDVVRLNQIITDGSFKEALTNRYGKGAMASLKSKADQVMKGGTSSQDGELVNIADKLHANISSALLASPTVATGQMAAIVQFRAEAKGKGFWKGVRNAKKNAELLKKYAPGVTERLMTEDTAKISRNVRGEQSGFERGMQKVRKVMTSLLSLADESVVFRGASGLFEANTRKYMADGMPQEAAYKRAGQDIDSLVARGQPGGSYISKAKIQEGAMKYLTTLKQAPQKIARGNLAAIRLYKKGSMSSRELGQYLFWNNVAQGTAYTLLRLPVQAAKVGLGAVALEALGLDEKAKDEFGKLQEMFGPKRLAGNIAFQIAQHPTGMPVVGDLFNTLVNNLAFGNRFEYRPVLGQVVFDDILAGGRDVVAGDYSKGMVKHARAISRSLGIGDPAGLFDILSKKVSQETTDQKKSFNKSFEGKQEARKKKLEKKNTSTK